MRHSLLAFCHRHVVCKFYDESVFDTCHSITSLYLEFYCQEGRRKRGRQGQRHGHSGGNQHYRECGVIYNS